MKELGKIMKEMSHLQKMDHYLKELNKILVYNMNPYEGKKLMYDLERKVLRDNTFTIYNAFKESLTRQLASELATKQHLKGLVEEEKQAPDDIANQVFQNEQRAENQAKHILGEEEICKFIAMLGDDEILTKKILVRLLGDLISSLEDNKSRTIFYVRTKWGSEKFGYERLMAYNEP